MRNNGYAVREVNTTNTYEIKAQYNVPEELRSCHTAIVDGYVIEGHVPAAEIERLLAERPEILGLAVAGMPIGSPGMEANGQPDQPYNVIAWGGADGQYVFASYPK